MHRFEKKGLGKPPYSIDKIETDEDCHGHCDYCGKNNLKYLYSIKSVDDSPIFIVGNDCVKKVDNRLYVELRDKFRERQREIADKEELEFYQGLERGCMGVMA